MTSTETPITKSVQRESSLLERLSHGSTVYTVQTFLAPIKWARGWSAWLRPPPFAANLVKTYECRSSLPVRIFFPKDYDQSSPKNIPLLFTIHGGGFTIGDPLDDEESNRRFADMHRFLVVALNYSKAPWSPFPTATYDLEALMLAVYDDESLPIDKSRIAVAGFSAGGNLTLSVCQLPSIRDKVKPSAALPIYPVMDESIELGERAKRRYYKPTLSKGLRNQPTDYLSRFSGHFNWSYIPYGHDLRDALLSPIYASRDNLPKHIYVIGAELDQLAHEDWGFACKLAGRPIPGPEQKVGRERPGETAALVFDDERFYFEHVDAKGGSIRWLLVPDVVHGFDHLPPHMQGGPETVEDARLKTVKYQQVLMDWLHTVVWKDSASASA